MDQKTIETSMGMILKAGNARNQLQEAVTCLLEDHHETAFNHIKEAQELIREAHVLQTTIIQSEARGEQHEFSLLFSHAQDTLMTIVSEHILVESMYKLYTKLDERLKRLEEHG